MIEEDYVSFEVAKLLKEKGFDAECDYLYVDGELVRARGGACNWNDRETLFADYKNECSAPTLQMVIKWIRKKGFHIFAPLEIDYDEDERGCKWYHDAAYYPEIIRISDGKAMYDDGSLYAEPEQAYEVAIRYYLENLI